MKGIPIISLMAAGMVAIGCGASSTSQVSSSSANGSKFVNARVARFYSLEREHEKQQHVKKTVLHVIDDRREVDQLVSYFPRVGEGVKSTWAGGWMPYAEIEFLRANGKSVFVMIDPEFEVWSENNNKGDHWFATGFADYFVDLLKRHEGSEVEGYKTGRE